MFRILSVSLLSLLLCASVAFAEKPLVVASDPTFPPNEMLNKDKEIVGFSIDYIKAVGKEAGFDVQVKNIAWDGIFAALASNQVDVIAASVSITDKRKKAMLFTDPYYELHQAVVLPLGKEIKSLEELAGKKVGGQIGTSAMVQTIPASKVKMIVKTYDEVGLAFEDLAKGNLDAVMCDDPVAKYYANTKEEYRDKFHIALVTGDPEYYGFALRKNDKELAEKLNAGIKAVREKGIEDQINEKWFGKKVEEADEGISMEEGRRDLSGERSLLPSSNSSPPPPKTFVLIESLPSAFPVSARWGDSIFLIGEQSIGKAAS